MLHLPHPPGPKPAVPQTDRSAATPCVLGTLYRLKYSHAPHTQHTHIYAHTLRSYGLNVLKIRNEPYASSPAL